MAYVSWPTLAEVRKCESVEACLRWNRFLPSPTDESKVEIINAVIKRLAVLRKGDLAGYVEASKRLGWD